MFSRINTPARSQGGRLLRGGAATTLALLVATTGALLTAGVASAHVTVNPNEAKPDSSQTFNVRVPTEKDNEATVRVRVEFPSGLTVSRFQPKPGWTREVERDGQQRLAAVTWSGGRIEPGEYDEFAFIARTPKDATALSFKAYQTYQGGETVEWVGAEGADRPAARVALRGAAGTGADDHSADGGTAAATAPSNAAAPVAGSASASADGSDLSLFAALAAGVLAVIAIVLSSIALARRPRPA
jgi:uncharacterized protein YcnI